MWGAVVQWASVMYNKSTTVLIRKNIDVVACALRNSGLPGGGCQPKFVSYRIFVSTFTLKITIGFIVKHIVLLSCVTQKNNSTC